MSLRWGGHPAWFSTLDPDEQAKVYGVFIAERRDQQRRDQQKERRR